MWLRIELFLAMQKWLGARALGRTHSEAPSLSRVLSRPMFAGIFKWLRFTAARVRRKRPGATARV